MCDLDPLVCFFMFSLFCIPICLHVVGFYVAHICPSGMEQQICPGK